MTSITYVYQLCAFLPALGLLAILLPNLKSSRRPLEFGARPVDASANVTRAVTARTTRAVALVTLAG